MKEIPLTQGSVALVDDADYGRVMQYKWCVGKQGKRFYAMRSGRKALGERQTVYLHKFILGLSGDVIVDHKDLNGLNCQRANLRECNNSQNGYNRRMSSNNTSGYKGVIWRRDIGKWRAHIQVGGKSLTLGTFETPELAHAAYAQAAQKHHGEFARAK